MAAMAAAGPGPTLQASLATRTTAAATTAAAAPTVCYSESALATARIESAQHLEELEKQGVLGLERCVKVIARPWTAGQTAAPGDKVVHLIRHGQGFHNLLGDLYRDFGQSVDSTAQGDSSGSPYARPELMDPPLTTVGRDQAKALRPTTAALEVDLVVVSPLQRAAQTAALAAPHLKNTKNKAVPWVAHPACAEQSGKNICDRHRDRDEIADDFPYVDLTMIPPVDDKWFPDERESARSVSDRAHAFALWLRDRPETHVLVATHSAWLFTLLNTAVTCEPKTLNKWFQTGELRSVVFSYSSSSDEAK